MSSKFNSAVTLAIVIIYTVLMGTGAFFQYSASTTFKEMLDGKESVEISPEDKESMARVEEHTQKSKLSNELKTTGRIFLLTATVSMSVLLIITKTPLKYYLIATIGSMVLGFAATMPWWLMSGVGIMNYYLEQFVFCGISAVVVAIAYAMHKMLSYKKA